MINSDDLRYFIEAAKTKNISRAAERLGITQPALSYSIKRMERVLNSKLFVRSKKGVELSYSGKLLLEKSSSFWQSLQELQRDLNEESHTPRGLIRLGCHTAVAQYTLPKFLPKFLKSYPDIKFELEHGLSRHMTERVHSSQLDVAIAVNPIRHPDLVIKEICTDRVTVWKHKKCQNQKLLMYEPSLSQTQAILRKLSPMKDAFDSLLESSSLELIARLLASRTACAILPEQVVKLIDFTDIEMINGAPVIHDKVCLVYRPEFRMNERGRVFSTSFREFFQNR